MTDSRLLTLKKERNKLLDAWRIAGTSQKNSILMRISDIDDELERHLPKKAPKQRKFRKNNIQLLKQV